MLRELPEPFLQSISEFIAIYESNSEINKLLVHNNVEILQDRYLNAVLNLLTAKKISALSILTRYHRRNNMNSLELVASVIYNRIQDSNTIYDYLINSVPYNGTNDRIINILKNFAAKLCDELKLIIQTRKIENDVNAICFIQSLRSREELVSRLLLFSIAESRLKTEGFKEFLICCTDEDSGFWLKQGFQSFSYFNWNSKNIRFMLKSAKD